MPVRWLLPAAALLAGAAPPDGNADVRAAAAAFDGAQQRGDRATLERMLAPDFLFVRGSGRIGDRRDFIEGFAGLGIVLQPFAITDRLLLRVAPDVAVVGGEGRIRGTENGKPFSSHFRYSDTFARRDGRWIVVYTQVTALP